MNVSAEIDKYPSLRFQGIRKNQSVADVHGRTENVKTVYPTTKKVCRTVSGGGGRERGGGGGVRIKTMAVILPCVSRHFNPHKPSVQ